MIYIILKTIAMVIYLILENLIVMRLVKMNKSECNTKEVLRLSLIHNIAIYISIWLIWSEDVSWCKLYI